MNTRTGRAGRHFAQPAVPMGRHFAHHVGEKARIHEISTGSRHARTLGSNSDDSLMMQTDAVVDELASEPAHKAVSAASASRQGATIRMERSLLDALANLGGWGRIEDTAVQPVVPLPAQTFDTTGARALYISRHVAEVNTGIYPELRTPDELEERDVWSVALAAMGKNIEQTSPSYSVAPDVPVVSFAHVAPSTYRDPDRAASAQHLPSREGRSAARRTERSGHARTQRPDHAQLRTLGFSMMLASIAGERQGRHFAQAL